MLYKRLMANTVSYGSKLHIPPTYYHLLAAQQEPNSQQKNCDFFGKGHKNGLSVEKWPDKKSKRVMQKNRFPSLQ